MGDDRLTIFVVFGTRPEIIKLMPVLRAIKSLTRLRPILISTGQQIDLLPDFVRDFGIDVDEELETMFSGQSLNQSLSIMIREIDRVTENYRPRAVQVQGDTTTALAGALSAHYRKIPVIHIEAGLRTGDRYNPFPEECNRRLISCISSLHMAPTPGNVATLRNEGVPNTDIILTGNPIVDAIELICDKATPSSRLNTIIDRIANKNLIVFTVHRRGIFGTRLTGYLTVVKNFLDAHQDIAVVVPVHPNPIVRASIQQILHGIERVELIDPLPYSDFLFLLKQAWLVLSDSGGVQEEVITLGKPLLVLRNRTERPEALKMGSVHLAPTPQQLADALEAGVKSNSSILQVAPQENPFGDGKAGPRIAKAIEKFLRKHTK